MVHIKYKNNSAQTESNVHCPANQWHSSKNQNICTLVKSKCDVNPSAADGTTTSLVTSLVHDSQKRWCMATWPPMWCVRHAQPRGRPRNSRRWQLLYLVQQYQQHRRCYSNAISVVIGGFVVWLSGFVKHPAAVAYAPILWFTARRNCIPLYCRQASR